jgi:hypothetical protein
MAKVTERKTRRDGACLIEEISGQDKSAEKITLD